MEEDRSPCIECERVKQNKSECAGSCEKLAEYQQKLPQYSLWRGESRYYSIPGLEQSLTRRLKE